LTAVKTLVQDGDQKKQYLGLMIASVIFDPALSNMERSSDFFNKSVANPLLSAIQNTVKKHEPDSEYFCASLKAFESVIKLIYSYFDPKSH